MHVAWTDRLEGPDADRYDEFVLQSPAGHAFQTRPWGAVARAGAPVTTRFVTVADGPRLVGTALLVRPAVAGVPLPWAWIDRGPVVSDPSRLGPCLRAIGRAARARGVTHLRVMPYWAGEDAAHAEQELRGCGYRDAQRPEGAHARTLRIDLRNKDESDLFAGPGKGQARWRAGQATKAGATTRRGGQADWTRLREMHTALMEAQRRRGKSASWWRAIEVFASDGERGALFVCEHQQRVVAACVGIRHGKQVTYAWGASVADDLPFTKAIGPLFAAIRWARALGCSTFDLGGIPLEGDSDPKRNAIATLKLDFERSPVRLVRDHARWLVP